VPDSGYDLSSASFFTDPYPTFAAMRTHDPVHLQPETGIRFLTRYDYVFELCRHPQVSARRAGLFFPPDAPQIAEESETVRRFLAPWMVFLDAPQHTRIRSIMTRFFTPKAIESLRPFVQATVDEALDRIREAGECDVIRDLGFPVPAKVIGHLLGLPPQDVPQFQDWVEVVFRVPGMQGDVAENIRAAHAAVRSLEEYFRGLLAERRERPPADADQAGDLIGKLLTADEQGRFVTEQELVSTCALLLVAGHETTTHTIGNGVIALLRHPDELRRLREEPGLLGSAIGEILRYDSSTGMIGRIPLEDIEIGGHKLPEGSLVMGVAHAANRDPDVFPDPDRFDLTRDGARQLGFGHGIHVCIGAALARLEAEVAIGSLVRAFPGLAPVTDDYEWIPSYAQRGVKALPVAV
jgi:cytochrome P450